MTKSTVIGRLNQELEAFGRKAQKALDEGKLHIEVLRLRRKRDNAARDLGLLYYRRERGGEVEARRMDALLLRIDDLEKELAQLELQLADARGQQTAGSSDAAAEPAAAPRETPAS